MGVVSARLQDFEIPKMWILGILQILNRIKKMNTKLLEEVTLEHVEAFLQRNEHIYELTLPYLAEHPLVYDKYGVAE